MCKKAEETVDHLLLHCDVASFVWNSLSLAVSVRLGLCLDGLLTCLHVGGHLEDQGVLLFGK
jgi:hypothetical protein